MIKKLRVKFITLSMLTLFVLLSVIFNIADVCSIFFNESASYGFCLRGTDFSWSL